MSNRYRLQKALNVLDTKKESISISVPGRLGVTKDNIKQVEVNGRPGYVWVRIRGSLSELVQAYNDQVSAVYDLPVVLERDKVDRGRWRVRGRDLGQYQNWGTSPYLPRHGAQHSFDPDSKGGDIVWVYGKQFMPLMVYPSGSSGGPNVLIEEGVFYNAGVWIYAGNTGTANILPDYKPTGSSNAKMALVWIDSNGNPQVEAGTVEFSSSITGNAGIIPYLPVMPSSYGVPLAGIRLLTGTATILWDNIYDVRPHIVGDGFIPTGSMSRHIIEDDGVVIQDRDTLNFVGDTFVVYDDPINAKTIVSGTASGNANIELSPNQVAFSDDDGNVIGWDLFKYYRWYDGDDIDYANLVVGGRLSSETSAYSGYSINAVGDYSGSGTNTYPLGVHQFDGEAKVGHYRGNNSESMPEYITKDQILGEHRFYGYGSGSFSTGYITAGYMRVRAREDFTNGYRLGSEFLWYLGNTGTASVNILALQLQANQAIFYKDVINQNGGGYYWGLPTVTGSWRSIVQNNRVEFQQYLSPGVWTTLGYSNTGTVSTNDGAEDTYIAVYTSPTNIKGENTLRWTGLEFINNNRISMYYTGTNAYIDTDLISPSDFIINCGENKTVVLEEEVWDDLRITPGSFDRPGVADPSIVAVTPGGGAITSYLYQFAVNNLASFTVQLPHSYKAGENIYAHVHWTPGANGVSESGSTVGWKLDYSWASINNVFPTMLTADLSDTCNGIDWRHEMSPEVALTGTSKGISSMLICNIKRTDTGGDDTWAGTSSGDLPLLLEIDFHFPIDTMGSRQISAK